jgi:hypothetical protein
MAIVNDDILKTYFETGDKPTQQQFANLIESKRHINDKIGTGDLTQEIIDILNSFSDNGAGYLLPIVANVESSEVYERDIEAGLMLEFVAIKSPINGTASIRLDGNDISDVTLQAGVWNVISICDLNDVARPLRIVLPQNSYLKIYRR